MTDSKSTPPGDREKNSNKIKNRLIWLGIVLAILAVLEVGNLIYRIAHPSMPGL